MNTDIKPIEQSIANENWARYRYGMSRGHREYTQRALLCERMYLGGGRQWSAEDLEVLKAQRRPAYELNEIKPAVNAAIGYQIQNRMDIQFRPRGQGTDQQKADIRTKVIKQIADAQRLHWTETQIVSDGLIAQRGFFEARIEFDANMRGNIVVTDLDPFDVIPDPDAKSYEPDGWSDVIITRWLTYDEIENLYGLPARKLIEARPVSDANFGDYGHEEGAQRSAFGADGANRITDAEFTGADIKRRRIIDRQMWVRKMTDCLVYPRTGDVKMVEELPADVVAMHLAQGAIQTRQMRRRVRWVVSAATDVLVHDKISPYAGFTVIPFFPYFRRGQTAGLVDDAIGPQNMINKAVSQYTHVINTSANSGWIVEENSLTNMTTQELTANGAKTGLVLEVKKGATEPKKIQPNQVPTGLDRMIDIAMRSLRDVTVPEAMRGITGRERSGIAMEHAEHASTTQLALPLDNLSRTRHMLAGRLNELVTQFYAEERVFRITEQDPRTGKPVDSTIVVNQWDQMTGTYLNDLTEGDYDVVVSEQPAQATFMNSQFKQALELRTAGVQIPDPILIQNSSLTRKDEILDMMEKQAGDPEKDAKAELLKAQARKTVVEAVNKAVEAMYSATQAGNQIAMIPQVAPLADKLLRSAGFQDADPPPIVPNVPIIPLDESGIQPPPQNTNPLTPANPAVGLRAGIEAMDSPEGAR